MNDLIENIGLIVFIVVVVFSIIFNAVGAKIKEAAAAAERSRDYQKKPHKFNPYGAESPEEFFDRVRQEEKPAQKLKLNQKHQLQNNDAYKEPPKNEYIHFEEAHPVVDETKVLKNKSKAKNTIKIDIKDKGSLRKAIIINEVLNPPKAYEL